MLAAVAAGGSSAACCDGPACISLKRSTSCDTTSGCFTAYPIAPNTASVNSSRMGEPLRGVDDDDSAGAGAATFRSGGAEKLFMQLLQRIASS